MNFKEVIEYKINMLIDLMITDGVSPNDLANNIFLDKYENISFYKEDDFIIGKLSFKTDLNELIQMRYIYSKDNRILRIEEQVNGKNNVLWDRSMRESEMVKDLLEFLTVAYEPKQVESFIKTLPASVRTVICNEQYKTA
ncbi:MAG: hypothetical protein AB7V48_00365 [Sedimentibacter sp.]